MYCTKREEMWNYLVDKFCIYPSVLWRTYLYDDVNTIKDTKKMGEQIISFPVDQRYGRDDMLFMADAINSFKG
jgi:dTDP-4-amino-4,6-dideoxygalactose transaminase